MGFNNALIKSVDENNAAKTTELLQQPSIDVNEKEQGVTALVLACKKSREKIAISLLSHPRVDVNITDAKGATPLHVACEQNIWSIVLLLLKNKNTDINKVNETDQTPFELVLNEFINVKMLNLFLDRPDLKITEKSILLSIKSGHDTEINDFSVMKKLLKHPALPAAELEKTFSAVMTFFLTSYLRHAGLELNLEMKNRIPENLKIYLTSFYSKLLHARLIEPSTTFDIMFTSRTKNYTTALNELYKKNPNFKPALEQEGITIKNDFENRNTYIFLLGVFVTDGYLSIINDTSSLPENKREAAGKAIQFIKILIRLNVDVQMRQSNICFQDTRLFITSAMVKQALPPFLAQLKPALK